MRFRIHVQVLLIGLVGLMVGCQSAGGASQASGDSGFGSGTTSRGDDGPYYGFTAFPFDNTAEAARKTLSIVSNNSNLFAIHLDDCLPWREMLNDDPFPRYKQQGWDHIRDTIPSGHKVYVALAFVGKQRKELAATCGSTKGQAVPLPAPLSATRFDDPQVKRAYLNYVRRAIRQFDPDFLNIGIEMDKIAHRYPGRWRQFQKLFFYVRDAIKQEHPDIQIGVSFGLQPLLDPQVAARIMPVVEGSDYFGLSFYPYSSAFNEMMGAPALPQAPQSWRDPLAWAARFTDKPVAICETGYTTRDIDIPRYGLHMTGTEQGQKTYVRDLLTMSKRENYMFVVWFLAVDYDRLYAKMPKAPETQVNLLWRNIGLLDGNLRPKPAWKVWQQYKSVGRAAAAAAPGGSRSARPQPAAGSGSASAPASSAPGRSMRLGFTGENQLPDCAPGSDVRIVAARGAASAATAMRWDYRNTGDWQWCVKPIDSDRVRGTERIRFRVRSDHARSLFVTVEEQGGEAFTKKLDVGKEWSMATLDVRSLTADAGKRQDGRLDADRIARIVFADATPAAGSRSVFIADLVFETATAAATGKQRAVNIGFQRQGQLFSCSPGSAPTLVDEGPAAAQSAMRWSIRYNGDWQWCRKDLDLGTLRGADRFRVWIRGDRAGPVVVQLEETGGEAFFAVVKVTDEWREVVLELSDLSVDAEKRRDGRLDPGTVKRILIADPASPDERSGARTVWFADMKAE